MSRRPLAHRALCATDHALHCTGDGARVLAAVREAERNLAVLQRQAVLSQLYVHDRNIVEAPGASVAHKPLAKMKENDE